MYIVDKYLIPPLNTRIKPVVASLVTCIISEGLGQEEQGDSASLEETAEILCAKIVLMPRYLGIPMLVLTLIFDWYGLLLSGKPFHKHAHPKRIPLIMQWKKSKIGICCDFIKFFERLSFFIYFSLPQPRNKLNY
jgi:hypothetical protein